MQRAVKVEPGVEYINADRYHGSKPGYIFKKDVQGLGYYRDRAAPAPGTAGGYAFSQAAKASGGGHRVAAANAAVKTEVKQESLPLRVVVPPAAYDGVQESPRPGTARDSMRWELQTPRTSRVRDPSGLHHDDGARRKQSKKREKKLQREDERTYDLALLRQHVAQAADLAGTVMERLDSKRRRFDARRVQGECEDWLDWQQAEEDETTSSDKTELLGFDMAAAKWEITSDLVGASSNASAIPNARGGRTGESEGVYTEWNWPFGNNNRGGGGRAALNRQPLTNSQGYVECRTIYYHYCYSYQ